MTIVSAMACLLAGSPRWSVLAPATRTGGTEPAGRLSARRRRRAGTGFRAAEVCRTGTGTGTRTAARSRAIRRTVAPSPDHRQPAARTVIVRTVRGVPARRINAIALLVEPEWLAGTVVRSLNGDALSVLVGFPFFGNRLPLRIVPLRIAFGFRSLIVIAQATAETTERPGEHTAAEK